MRWRFSAEECCSFLPTCRRSGRTSACAHSTTARRSASPFTIPAETFAERAPASHFPPTTSGNFPPRSSPDCRRSRPTAGSWSASPTSPDAPSSTAQSSTTRPRTARTAWRRSSKRHAELRPAALPVLQREREAVVVQDLGHDGEPEAAAFALGGEKGREELVARGGIDAAAGIGDGERAIPERDRDLAILADRLHRVADDVDDDLLELALI